jgi:hypothetical protein
MKIGDVHDFQLGRSLARKIPDGLQTHRLANREESRILPAAAMAIMRGRLWRYYAQRDCRATTKLNAVVRVTDGA